MIRKTTPELIEKAAPFLSPLMTNGSPSLVGKVKTVSLHVGSTKEIACDHNLTTAYVGKPFYCCVEWTADPPDDTIPFEYVYDEFIEGGWQQKSGIGEFPATKRHEHNIISWWEDGQHTIRVRMRRKDVQDDWEESNSCTVNIGKVENVTVNKNAACINEKVTFTVDTDPDGYYDGVVWKIGINRVQNGGQTFEMYWPTTGTKTITACLGDSCKSKTIEFIDGLTVVPKEAYVPVEGTKDFEAWICEGGSAVKKTSADGVKWKAKPGRGYFTGDTYHAPGTPSSGEGSDWVKATYDKKESYSTLTVFKIKSETVATLPTNRSRTLLGLGEEVDCSTEPLISVQWWLEGEGSLDTEIGTSTRFTAVTSPSYATVHAEKGTADCSLDFEVIEPDGESVTWDSTSGWTPGPPNNQIGPGQAKFICTISPTSVNFYNVWLRENIPGDDWIWPDGTEGNRPAQIVRFKTYTIGGVHNRCEDYVSEGPFPISRLHDGIDYQDHSHIIRVPLEYQNKLGSWTSCLPSSTHTMQYQGSDQKARVQFNASNVDYSEWVGPWQ